MKSVEVEVRNPQGLHARPAATFVRAVARYRARVTVENLSLGKPPADARSLVEVLAAGVRRGHRIRIAAEGDDETAAAEGLRELVESGLGERIEPAETPEPKAPVREEAEPPEPSASEPSAPEPPAPNRATAAPSAGPAPLRGLPGAPGIAVGQIWRFVAPADAAPGAVVAPHDAAAAIRDAAHEAARELEELAERLHREGRAEEAAIFHAQSLVATDHALVGYASARAASGVDPVAAVRAAANAAADRLAGLEDETLAARAADVRDVGERIVRRLSGTSLSLPASPVVAVASDLPPSVAAEIPPGLLLGIALEAGSPTAHAVILARGLGIPAIVGVRGLLASTETAAEIGIDGASGDVFPDPTVEQRADLDRRAAARPHRRATAGTGPARTSDGLEVALLANIGNPGDVPRALAAGAGGVGLFRTEFLFLGRSSAPSEDEQTEAYRSVLEAFGPDRPVVIRLADVGADKAIPYLGLAPEANPFLGVRAIRLAGESLGRELLLTQLRAIWRAGALARVTPHVMAPMVATPTDVDVFVELRDEARRQLEEAGVATAERLVTGIMVEIPSAALLARELGRMVDFFSIGTNDLTGYTLAVDRGNAALGPLHDALAPGVLRLVAETVRGADDAGISVAVCGELGGDPAGALVLAGLGVDELSADAGSLDGLRDAFSAVSRADLEALAERALAATDARTVRALANRLLERGALV